MNLTFRDPIETTALVKTRPYEAVSLYIKTDIFSNSDQTWRLTLGDIYHG